MYALQSALLVPQDDEKRVAKMILLEAVMHTTICITKARAKAKPHSSPNLEHAIDMYTWWVSRCCISLKAILDDCQASTACLDPSLRNPRFLQTSQDALIVLDCCILS